MEKKAATNSATINNNSSSTYNIQNIAINFIKKWLQHGNTISSIYIGLSQSESECFKVRQKFEINTEIEKNSTKILR